MIILIVVCSSVALSARVASVWRNRRGILTRKETTAALAAEKIESAGFRFAFEREAFGSKAGHSHSTHPAAASDRARATDFGMSISLKTGMEMYIWQMSATNQNMGFRGWREYFWGKDLKTRPQDDDIPENAFILMVDVDYYMDMPEHLVNHPKPHIIYSYQPLRAAGQLANEDGSFRFVGDKLEMKINGGGSYSHAVWSYNLDSIVVTNLDDDGNLLPPSDKERLSDLKRTPRTVFYEVERKTLPSGHTVTALIPTRIFTSAERYVCWRHYLFESGPRFPGVERGCFGNKIDIAHLALTHLDSNPLVRYAPLTKYGFNILMGQVNNIMYVSVSRDGGYVSGTVSMKAWEAMLSIANTSRRLEIDLSRTTIRSLLSVHPLDTKAVFGEEVEKHAVSAVIHEYFFARKQAGDCLIQTTYVYPVPSRAITYEFKSNEPAPVMKPAAKAFMNPLSGPPLVPAVSQANNEAAVRNRITMVKNDPIQPDRFTLLAMNEFVDWYAADHSLHPTDHQEVFLRQNRPAQRAILLRADQQGSTNNTSCSSFMKKEVYGVGGGIKDPRIITTVPGPVKLEYSTYMYALSEHVKKTDWYIFGKDPKGVAETVVKICENSEGVCMGDLSRMDGRVSNVGRLLTKAFSLRCFAPEYRVQLTKLLETQINVRCYMGDTSYKSGTARLSGSPETSVFNSLESAFTVYLAYRLDGKSKEEAFEEMKKKASVGGDDNIAGDVTPASLKKAAKALGHIMTFDGPEIVRKGEPGINFLSRRYSPNVAFGDQSSCCDIQRTVAKFHMAVHLGPTTTALAKMVEKAEAMLLTDRDTPIIGDFCKCVERLNAADTRTHASGIREKVKWFSQWKDLDRQFPNVNYGGWMDKIVNEDLPHYHRAELIDWLDGATSLEELLEVPTFNQIPPNPTANVEATMTLGEGYELTEKHPPVLEVDKLWSPWVPDTWDAAELDPEVIFAMQDLTRPPVMLPPSLLPDGWNPAEPVKRKPVRKIRPKKTEGKVTTGKTAAPLETKTVLPNSTRKALNRRARRRKAEGKKKVAAEATK